MRIGWIAIIIVVILIAAGVFFFKPNESLAPSPSGTSTAANTATSYADEIQVTTPASGAVVTSPLMVSGRALGSWYFEAQFPVMLEDQTGKVIAQSPAKAQANWMTNDFVPFTATLTFTAPTSTNIGTLVLKNDNPSGDPSRNKYVTIPVRFR